MIPNRPNMAAGNQYAEKLTYLRTTLNDMRTSQTFGSSNVRTYRLFNATTNTEITVSNVTTSTPRCVEVTLTPQTAASNPVIAFDFSFSFTSPSGGTVIQRFDALPPVAGVQKFRVYIMSNDVTKDIALAFTFWTISPGTYTFAEVTP
ncbi:hypothetical protein QFZ60_001604 [Arthrobacter sp. B2I5]|nr:hypothetical protein [Arthrobacter sp. B2I5]